MNLKNGALLAIYILYRLKGGPTITEKLKEKALDLVGRYLPIVQPVKEQMTIQLNKNEFRIM